MLSKQEEQTLRKETLLNDLSVRDQSTQPRPQVIGAIPTYPEGPNWVKEGALPGSERIFK